MIINLEQGDYSAAVDTTGAELKSFRDKRRGDEMVWQADADVWNGSAPILFPVIGRMKDGGYRWNGQKWEMPKHGLVRKQHWAVVRQSVASVTLRTSDNDFTRRYYPAAFTFDATFAIDDGTLKVTYNITNNGNDVMLFSVGSHPGISLPMNETALEDYYLCFNRPESCSVYRLSSSGLLAVKPEKMLCGEVKIPLSQNLFRDDALFLLGIASDEIRVCNDRTGRVISVNTCGAPDLGLWAKPGAAYVCIEPWFGYDDPENHDGNLENKPGILRLAPGAAFSTGYEIKNSCSR